MNKRTERGPSASPPMPVAAPVTAPAGPKATAKAGSADGTPPIAEVTGTNVTGADAAGIEAAGAGADAGTGRYSYEGLERVIHERARLSIMASLVAHPEGLLFGDLKDLCTLTDGNLSRHLQMLQEAGLVEVWKGFKRNRPQTLCRLTDPGRKRFGEYISVLESVVADALSATGRAAEARLPSRGVSPA